ncbi:MAG: hypothetical protein H6927_07100 [Burkholderiaceae bacterium]|nr:hypothetical protein [Burkholderiaceae bacterium]MCP5217867.1 hypothetical protein [Burkholderiaceae bacterium]
MDAETSGAPDFEREHHRLDALLRAHLLAVVGQDFAGAQQKFVRWHRGLLRHIEIENTRLLPHVPAGARWDARIYLLEHERIALLAQEHAARMAALAQRAPRGEPARRRAALALLDAAHALRHLLEHHHQREEMALAHELPAALQAAAWASG